jgi:hypothetical protein
MIAKAVVTALSFQTTEFPKAPAGQPPNETFTYYDRETERDPRAVTVLVDRGIPAESRPKEFEPCVVVLQIEEVERAVKRQDREDGSRTYDSVSKQYKMKVLDFEPAPAKANGKAAAPPAKAAA